MTIYTLPSRGLSTLTKELTTTTRVMQTPSNELSTLVYGKPKYKQTIATTGFFNDEIAQNQRQSMFAFFKGRF